MQHVMVDLETLGTSPGSVILSIGAVKFDPTTTEMQDTFHVAVCIDSAIGCGLTVSGATMKWWFDPTRADAMNELLSMQEVDLPSALDGFAQWFGPDSLPVWGCGAAFDNVLLRAAYEKLGLECPWKFWDDRCYRTMKAVYPRIKAERTGTHHNALSDAITQARHLQAIYAEKDAEHG